MKMRNLLLLVSAIIVISVLNARAASEVKLIASDAQAYDSYGYSVAINGDYAMVGAYKEDTKGEAAGAVYFYHRTDTNTWDTGIKITSYDAEPNDYFGYSVGISGDYAIIGASGEDSGGSGGGAVYIFRRTDTNTWSSGIKIIAPGDATGDEFGVSVAIDGDYAIIGVDRDDEAGGDAGAAYIYHRTGVNTWSSSAKLLASDAEIQDFFGISVAISDPYAIVGAYYEDSGGSNAGAAYIFYRTDTNTWDAGTKLVAPDAEENDRFGRSVGISGDYAIVGAEYEDEGGSNAGSAYIYHRTGTNTWDAGTKIIASDPGDGVNFGRGVSISGPYVSVGAMYENTGGTYAGAAYLYSRTGENTWSAGTKIMASDFQSLDQYGSSVAIHGYYTLIGASSGDSATVDDTGAAYVYMHDLPATIDLLSFTAEWANAGAALSWTTGSETNCGAFTILRCEIGELWRETDIEEYQELDIVIPCADSLYGAEYEVLDQTADSTTNYAYILREYETTGAVHDSNPIFLYADKYGDDRPDDDAIPSDDDAADPSDDDAEIPDEASTGSGRTTDDEEAAEDNEIGCGY